MELEKTKENNNELKSKSTKDKNYKKLFTIEDLDKAYLAGVNGENYIQFIEKLKLNE